MIRPNTRRAFVCGLVVLAACPRPFDLVAPASAQQPAATRRVGVLLLVFSPEGKEAQAFRDGLRDAGYAEGRDVVIEWRSTSGDYSQVPELIADLVRSKVEVIVVDSTVATHAVKRAAPTVPVVMTIGADPVGSGLVASLAHPGGNVTGLTNMVTDLTAKRLQLLKEAIPTLRRVAVMRNPATAWHTKAVEDLKAVAPSLSLELKIVEVATPEEIGPAFTAIDRAHAQALYVIGDPFFFTHRMALLKPALKARLPTMHTAKQYVDAGGLMSYGASFSDLMRRSAGYVDTHLPAAVKSRS